MLSFGTSGLRGLVTDMTDQECYLNALGYLRYLLVSRQVRPGDAVSLGGDLRTSTARILEAVGRAVTDAGLKVDHCGRIPSPALMSYALGHHQASIMVTGSHIPDDRNGIKFNTPAGEVLKSDEAGILDQVRRARSEGSDRFDAQGRFQAGVERGLPPAHAQAAHDYVARYSRVFPKGSLQGKTVVLDQHSAVGRDLLAEILTALGATVVPVGRSERFVPKDTENVTPETLRAFEQLAQQHHPFAIVSTDGDSDRPFVVDEAGKFYRGDVLGALVAGYLGARFAAVPVSANDIIPDYLEKKGIELVQTRIGSPFVIAAMQNAILRGKAPVVGWEVNGGFMLATDLDLQGVRLPALPTRDAVLPILAALLAGVQAGSLSRSFKSLSGRFTQAGLLDEFPVAISQKMIVGLSPQGEGIEEVDFNQRTLRLAAGKVQTWERRAAASVELTGFWRSKAGKAQPETIQALLEQRYFTSQLGFGKVDRINWVDGVRIYFSNQEVAHIRPSGNAPQLRIYANAGSQARADEIVQLGLADKGMLRIMESDIQKGI